MTGLRRALLLVAAEGLVVGFVALALTLSSDHADEVPLQAVLGLFIGWSFIGVGLYAWWRRPENRFGVIMTGVGFAWFLGALTSANSSWLFTIGCLLSSVYAAVFVHMLLAYPSGRVGSRRLRRVLGFGYALAVLGPLPALLFSEQVDPTCDDCPPSAIFISDSPTLGDVFDLLASVAAIALVGYVSYVLLARYRAASAPRRSSMAPVVWSGVALLVLLAGSLTTMAVGGPRPVSDITSLLGLLALAATPYMFLFGIVRTRFARGGAVSDLLQELGRERERSLRDLLADALGDRSLHVLYWLDERREWVDANGRLATLPAENDRRQSWTAVEREGRRVGAIVHDREFADDPELVQSVAAAAGLTIENERLQAQLRARVQELRTSRARIVEAGTAERRRLERNLHDGAQQRLVALSLTLRVAQNRIDTDPDAARSMLAGAQEELTLALAELRELARGIHPAVLSDRGLHAALEALAGRSPVPVELAATPEDRLPAPVEAAAYFVVAEALTNVAKYAQATQARVSVSRSNGHAVVEVAENGVGGADPARGTGLRGLADRLSALDGRLEVRSPQGAGTLLRAEIPV